MTPRRPGTGRLWAVVGLLSAVAALACATAGPAPREPLLESLVVPGLVIEPVALEGADASSRDWFRELLAEQATATARRASLERQLARVLDSNATAPGNWQLSGRVSVPVALPREYRGSRAAFQEGHVAVARLELLDHRRQQLATVEASVRWPQVRWTTGGKTRRVRRPDAALLDAVELAVDRAVRQLVLQLPLAAHAEERP